MFQLSTRPVFDSSVIVPRSESFRQVAEYQIGQFSPKLRVMDSQRYGVLKKYTSPLKCLPYIQDSHRPSMKNMHSHGPYLGIHKFLRERSQKGHSLLLQKIVQKCYYGKLGRNFGVSFYLDLSLGHELISLNFCENIS